MLYEVARTMDNVDATRFGVIGRNFDGLAALNFQLRNMSADAIVTIDGWEAKQGMAGILRGAPMFDPLRIRVPYLTFQQDNAPTPQLTPGRDLFDQLDYSERMQYVLRDLDHFHLLQPAFELPLITDEKKLGYDFMHVTIVHFFDTHVKRTSAAMADPTAAYPAWLFEMKLTAPALAAVPIPEELEPIVMSGDAARVTELFRRAKRENPEVRLFTRETMNLFAFRFWQRGDRDKAIALYQLNIEAFPNSVHTHNNLGNAYRDTNQAAAALASFRRALELVDTDPEILPSEKQASRDVIQRKIDQLARED
jgi:hypothetical protein